MTPGNADDVAPEWDDAVPFEARRAMQQRLWEKCIRPGGNEWTTWTDSILLAECAASALWLAGYRVTRIDGPPSGG